MSIQDKELINVNAYNLEVLMKEDILMYIDESDDYLFTAIDFPKFAIFENDQINKIIFTSMNGREGALAEIIYYYYKDEFKYSNNDTCYIYKNHKWSIFKNNNKMTQIVFKKLKLIYNHLITHAKFMNLNKNIISKLLKTKINFDNKEIKENILKEIRYRFIYFVKTELNFENKLNVNTDLIVFNNGVYDLKNFVFKNGKPNDNMSYSVGYDYVDTHTYSYNDLLNLISIIVPDNDEKDYLLTHLACALQKSNTEFFTMFLGLKTKIKSNFINLIKNTFGDYCKCLNGYLLSSSFDDLEYTDILDFMRRKLILISESKSNKILNNYTVRLYSKNSMINYMCHQFNEKKIVPSSFATIYICDEIPEIEYLNSSLIRRLRCIDFSESNNHDNNLNVNNSLIDWKIDFMLLLIEYYKKYKMTNKNIATEKILRLTNNYQYITKEKRILHSEVQKEWLININKELGMNIQSAVNGKEHKIKNSRYHADGYDAVSNTIFEFQGCYYHGCVECFSNRNKMNLTTQKTFAELYDKTQIKKLHCIKEEYKYVEIWECEWKNYKKNTLLMKKYFKELKDLCK